MNRRDLLKRGFRLAAAAPVVALLGPSAFATPKQDEWTRMGGKFVLGLDVGNGESFAVHYAVNHHGIVRMLGGHPGDLAAHDITGFVSDPGPMVIVHVSRDGGVTWRNRA